MIRKKARRKSRTKTVIMPTMVAREIAILISKMVAIGTMITTTTAGPRTWWRGSIAQDGNTAPVAT